MLSISESFLKQEYGAIGPEPRGHKVTKADARVRIQRLKEKFPIAVTSELVQQNMIGILRQCLVDEWLDNPSEYAPFITSNEKKFEDMAKEFLTPGHFASEIGIQCQWLWQMFCHYQSQFSQGCTICQLLW